jgi:Family of unknown function (DUF5999)
MVTGQEMAGNRVQLRPDPADQPARHSGAFPTRGSQRPTPGRIPDPDLKPAAARTSVDFLRDSITPLNSVRLKSDGVCSHRPRCPDAQAPDRVAVRPIARHPEQGWSLLCNAVVLFDDGDQLHPDGWAVFPAAAYTTAAWVRNTGGQ